MNPLKEHAHLFANGKFKLRYDRQEYFWTTLLEDGEIVPILSVRSDYGLEGDFVFEVSNKDGEELPLQICEVTLIARPIEDMTADEWAKHWFNGEFGYDDWKDKNRYCSHRQMPFVAIRDFLYIGVYPFDQSHFDDGTVIKATQKPE